jgi:hypothetical protein
MLDDVATSILEDMTGAGGDLSRSECIRRAASNLVDYVHEALWNYGIGYGDEFQTHLSQETYRAIETIVAVAMVTQYELDRETWGSVLATDELPDDPTSMKPAGRALISAMRGFIKQQQQQFMRA